MTSSKQQPEWSVRWKQLLIVGVIGALGYSAGMNWGKSRASVSVPQAELKQLLKERRANQSKLKAEGEKVRRLKSSQAQLLDALEVEDIDPLRVTSSFSHHMATGRYWVNIAAWGNDGFFCCDYSDVHYLDAKDGRLHKIPAPGIDGKWCPTGLACEREHDILLVANYEGHNVLEFHYAEGRLEPQWTYQCEGMKSPEGVAVSRDGKLGGVADYDGDRLWVFNRRGSLLWHTEIGRAHGVAFGAESVYVTGLLDKCVQQFSLTGSEVRKIGRMGWGDSEFLWPTSISADEQGVIVSDAHTGKVSLFNHDLSFVRAFGGNGPGVGLFNLPYCAIRHQNKFWICDTFKQRILVSSPSAEVEREFSASPPVASANSVNPPTKVRWSYTDLSSPIHGKAPQFPDGLIYPDYGTLMRVNDESGEWKALNLRVPITSLWSPGGFTYFTWMQTIELRGLSFVAIGSVSHAGIFVVSPDGRCSLENTGGGSPLQTSNGKVYERDGTVFDLKVVADSAIRKCELHDRLLLQPGALRLEVARAAFWPEVSAADIAKRLAQEFQSEAGKKFWSSFSTTSIPSDEFAAAAEFDAALRRSSRHINLTEFWLRNILVPRPHSDDASASARQGLK